MCWPGRRNALRRGRTKELDQKGGQYAIRSCSLNPNRHLSMKPGQAHGGPWARVGPELGRSWARDGPARSLGAPTLRAPTLGAPTLGTPQGEQRRTPPAGRTRALPSAEGGMGQGEDRSSHILPAVGVEAGTGDEPRCVVGKKRYTACHLLHRTEAADRNEGQDLAVQDFFRHRLHHLRGDVAWRDDV